MPELQGAFSDGLMMKIIILFFVIFFSSCFYDQKPTLVIPEPRKDEIFSRFINPITDKYELAKLRETSLSNDDLELRVWTGVFDIDGFILKRINNEWSAIAIKEIDCKRYNPRLKDKIYELGKINFASPKSGWENAWQKLEDAGIVDLPYTYYVLNIDEGGYALETNINGTYRIRFYGNQDENQEAQQMKKIGEIIADEFGLSNFKVGSVCLEK